MNEPRRVRDNAHRSGLFGSHSKCNGGWGKGDMSVGWSGCRNRRASEGDRESGIRMGRGRATEMTLVCVSTLSAARWGLWKGGKVTVAPPCSGMALDRAEP